MFAHARWLALLPVLIACDKKEASGAATATASVAAAESAAPPHVWRDVPPSDGGVRDAGSSRENLMRMKERLKAKVASGTADEREKKMLTILCKNLGDESCSPADAGKGDPHGH